MKTDFDRLIESAATAALVADEQGDILLISDPALQLFGYERSELIGQSVQKLIPIRFHSEHDYHLASHLRNPAGGAMDVGRAVTGLHKDGQEIAVEVSLSPVTLGDRLLVAAWIRDDERRREMERELRSYHERLAHMGRVAFASEMVAGIAHELSQPLTASVNYAEAIQIYAESGKTEPEQLGELTQPLIEQVLRAGDIVRNLRDFVSGKNPKSCMVRIEDLIESAVRFLHNELNAASIRLEVQIEPGLPMIRCVEVQIAQVLDNLIRNAIDALSHLPIERRKVLLQATQIDGELRMTVTDWGDGVCDGASANLFDQFFTTKKVGMGIGLSICRSIVEQHGGEITQEKAEHGGAAFTFTLHGYQDEGKVNRISLKHR
ncbi:MAG: PAS domain S-box protein [Phycisphaeraceae bacterium]|nr:PAS domain S-box protein [Phycisphaeraceae bacterium]